MLKKLVICLVILMVVSPLWSGIPEILQVTDDIGDTNRRMQALKNAWIEGGIMVEGTFVQFSPEQKDTLRARFEFQVLRLDSLVDVLKSELGI